MSGSHSPLFFRGLAAVFFVSFAVPSMTAQSFAHQAKSGWTYPSACCSDRDCREIPHTLVSERPDGYVINPTGEVVSYTDRRVRESPDGVYHWCSVAGKDDSRTICLFVPPRSF